jgi:hypothetical protein
MTADVLWTPRRGTSSAHALQAWAPDARRTKSASATGRVLRSVQRPVHVHSPQGERSRRHRGWANLRKREEPAPGSSKADVARLAVHHRSARRGVAHQKRKVVEATVPARIRSPGLVARTSNQTQLQKSSGGVWPRISSVRAPKNGAGASERGPSPRRRAAGNTVVRRRERKVRRGFGLTRVSGERPDEDPGWRESAIQRSHHRPKGGVAVVGPGL